ncbi:MAG: hypothetical protein P9L92_05915 [Candidatus Electryonea clarkiae]|nr:hypothetical protein [Candidatus Electryonea clarkiae]MDP8288776.1 hypothetical protein [Candidatus Electryonea clarkiae]
MFTTTLIVSCAPVAKFQRIVDYSVDPPDKTTQTKQGVSIKMKYIDQDAIKNNRLYTQRVLSAGFLTTEVSELKSKDVYVSPFLGKLAFDVTIENNTDHILRMGDARVVYVENQSMDGPVPALNKPLLMQSAEDHPVVLHYRTKGSPVDDAIASSWVTALNKVYLSNKLKIINDFGMEIFPHFSASGILVFSVPPEKATGGKVSFFDITTKVDNAGNPTEKEHFDFAIKANERFFRTLGQETVEITSEEYNAQ